MAKRKQEHEKEPNHERWLVSYADFITLLFAVFVTLYAMSYTDKQKVEQVIASYNAAFGMTKSGSAPTFNVIQSNEMMPVPGIVPEKRRRMTVPESGELGKKEEEKKKAEEEAKKKQQQEEAVDDIPPPDPKKEANKVRADNKEFQQIKEKISAYLKEKGAEQNVKLTVDQRGLVISLKDTEFFDSGSAAVRGESKPLLRDIAAAIDNYTNSIRIEGHTDNVPIKTSAFPSNWELSTARATNIVQYLVGTLAFSPEKLSAIGYGEYRPIADNSTPEGRQKNRRVDIVILSASGEQGEPTGLRKGED
jgi:chemotaxis protein MotB